VFTEAEKVSDASKYGTKRVVNWTTVGLGDWIEVGRDEGTSLNGTVV